MSKELPSIEELKASQKAGSEGKGTNPETFADRMRWFNQGTGPDGDEAKPDAFEATV